MTHQYDQFIYQRSKTNPYQDKLESMESSLVLTDHNSEQFQGKWASHVFQNTNPITLEIGVGYGDFMVHHSQAHPEENFVGMDIRFKRSFGLASKLAHLKNTNFRLLRADGIRIPHIFSAGEVGKLYYFFPDPWPKTRHHKKRLFQHTFLEKIAPLFQVKGEILFKTDHDELFDWCLAEIKKQQAWYIQDITYDLYANPGQPLHAKLGQFQTRFETLFLSKGIKIKALVLCRTI
jgi:tRNA (guanine-N7-)-methyltransferase